MLAEELSPIIVLCVFFFLPTSKGQNPTWGKPALKRRRRGKFANSYMFGGTAHAVMHRARRGQALNRHGHGGCVGIAMQNLENPTVDN